jgi:hypothetical protein
LIIRRVLDKGSKKDCREKEEEKKEKRARRKKPVGFLLKKTGRFLPGNCKNLQK